MSYHQNQQQGYPPYQGNSPVPPQQQGYGQPPNPYPQSNSPYPPNPQQNWNQPPPPMQNQQYQQPGYAQNQQLQYNAPPNQQPPYGAPPNQYGVPQQQQAYGAPPNQYPQQQGWNQPPPNQYPQQGYPPGPPPPGQPQYGAPPNQYGGPPNQFNGPPQPYGAPGQPQFGAPGQAPFGEASPGYGHIQTAQIDVSSDVESLHKAMKGFGTNEKELIRVLSKADPLRVNTIRMAYNQRLMKDLIRDLEKETSGYFEKGLVQIARGPLTSDCYNLRDAMKGIGTKEAVLDDVLIGRSNADINAIKMEYQKLFHTSLEADLRGDLSAGTEQLFVMIAAARRQEEAAPVIPQQIDADVNELQRAIGSMISKDATQTCQILTSKSDAQLRAITQTYQQKYQKSLDEVIKSKFSGHMENALRLLLARANNRALSDAMQLEDAMAGLGTKDELLVQRVVRAHWNPQHMQQVNAAYKVKYKKDLYGRIEGETRGDYERLMVGCVR